LNGADEAKMIDAWERRTGGLPRYRKARRNKLYFDALAVSRQTVFARDLFREFRMCRSFIVANCATQQGAPTFEQAAPIRPDISNLCCRKRIALPGKA
jgi:hypothetical protein